jgi:hypothetical protein
MKRLDLRPSTDGELCVWEKPIEGREYVIGCDPSLGRVWSEGADKSAICVLKRCQGKKLEQVAEWYGRWPIGRMGEVIATLGRAYGGWVDVDGREHGCAMINIERNLMDTAKYGLCETQGYGEEFLFIPREHRSVLPGMPKVFFTTKSSDTQHYLVNTLIDYMDRGALILRSKPTIEEMVGLEKDERGTVHTRGKDRSVAVIMAVVADHELLPCADYDAATRVVTVEDCPVGVDPVGWKRLHGLDDGKRKFTTYPGWERQGA